MELWFYDLHSFLRSKLTIMLFNIWVKCLLKTCYAPEATKFLIILADIDVKIFQNGLVSTLKKPYPPFCFYISSCSQFELTRTFMNSACSFESVQYNRPIGNRPICPLYSGETKGMTQNINRCLWWRIHDWNKPIRVHLNRLCSYQLFHVTDRHMTLSFWG